MRSIALILVLAACNGPEPYPETTLPEETGVTMVGDQCCCAFVEEGDILVEDLRLPADCAAEPSGECILVDPGRFTPHPCCPDATGERCGD